jgi:hypothetical protein
LRPDESGLIITSPVLRDVWETALKSDSGAVVTQSLPWRDCVLAGGRYADLSRLYEFPSGRRVVLPLVRRRGVPTATAVVSSWPRTWSPGGPICPDGPVSTAEAAAVLADVSAMRALVTELRLRHDARDPWLTANSWFHAEAVPWWIIDLTGGAGDVWERKFRGSVRRAIRKAERSGVDVESGRSGRLLGEFCELHRKSVIRWAHTQHGPVWLTRRRRAADTNPGRLALVAGRFGADCTTWVARYRDRPVAARIVLRSGAYAKGWQAAMDTDLAASLGGVSQLLDWLTIKDACDDGYRYFDLGFARPGSSVGGYKQRLGAELQYNSTLRAERVPLSAAMNLPAELAKKAIGFRDNI